MTSQPIIAAFDFDHTITDRDSLLPFLFFYRGFLYGSMQLAVLSPFFVGYILGCVTRQRMKEKFLERFIRGRSEDDLCSAAEDYARNQLNRFVKPASLKKLAWHRSQGHRCLLISASLELYLRPWADLHDFDDVLASKLEWTASGHATGRLLGLNCWGQEKVRRLLDSAGSKESYQLYVYGDSRGDKELLDYADHPYYQVF